MIKHDQIIFNKLPTFLGEAKFRRLNGSQQKARDYLESWQDKMGLTQVDVDPSKTQGYDKAWTFVYNTRPIGQRRSNSKCDVLIIAISSITQKIKILNSRCHNGQISDLRTPNRVEDEIIEYHQELEEAEAGNRNNHNLYRPRLNQNSTMKNIRSLDAMFSLIKKNQSHASQLLAQSVSLHQILNLKQMDLKEFEEFLKEVCDETLRSEFDELSEAMSQHLNQQVLQWSNDVLDGMTECDTEHPISVYNWILSAPNKRAQGFRYTAMMQLKFTNDLCWDMPIWDNIDDGQSPIKLLANQCEISAGILRNIAKYKYDFFNLYDAKAQSKVLSAIDPHYWPDTSELTSFRRVVDLSEAYAMAFNRDQNQTLKSWVKNNNDLWADNRLYPHPYPWGSLLLDLLERQIMPILEDDYKDLGHVPHVAIDDPGEITIKKAMDRYKNTVSNIKDMKRDVTNRIVSPVVLLELEKYDVKIADASVLEPILSGVQDTIWGKSLPSEQLSASSYWHSERVDIQTRFNSAALTGRSIYGDWHPLFKEAYFETKNGLRLYPLTSTEQLKEEGQKMSHCVGSYSSRCFKDNYHIFSVRDKNGNRISTLTVQDYFENSKRSIRVAINLTYNDASATKEAREAAQDFVETYNKDSHDFNTNWQAIDLTRAKYKQQEIENSAGYDFRDPTQAQSVFNVYNACLPKKLSRACECQFNQLSTALGIHELVQSFVENFDFSQGGLVRMTEHQTIPTNVARRRNQNRPRIAG